MTTQSEVSVFICIGKVCLLFHVNALSYVFSLDKGSAAVADAVVKDTLRWRRSSQMVCRLYRFPCGPNTIHLQPFYATVLRLVDSFNVQCDGHMYETVFPLLFFLTRMLDCCPEDRAKSRKSIPKFALNEEPIYTFINFK